MPSDPRASLITIEVEGDFQGVIDGIPVAIENISQEFVMTQAEKLKRIMIRRAPVGVRPAGASLRGAIQTMKNPNRRSPWAAVKIMSTNRNDLVALANEFGYVRPRRFYIGPGTRFPALRRWVMTKTGGWAQGGKGQNYVTIGGPRTRLGNKNKFIWPSIDEMYAGLGNDLASLTFKEFTKIPKRWRRVK